MSGREDFIRKLYTPYAITTGQLLVLFGLESAELSEGQAARLLGVPDDPIAVRELREKAILEVRKVLAGGKASIEPIVVEKHYGGD